MRAVRLTASVCAAALALALAAAGTALAQYAMVTEPVLPDGPLEQVSPHVWVLRGFPNVAFVVGDKATLPLATRAVIGTRSIQLMIRGRARAVGEPAGQTKNQDWFSWRYS
jgi:hypothetical protein